MAHDVFICHASEDRNLAMAAVDALETAGIRCWIAPRDPIAGVPYPRQLVQAINDARILLLILSQAANLSDHVMREVEIASRAEATIVPMRVEDVQPSGDLSYYITRIHWLDAFTPPLDKHLSELVALARNLLDKPQAEPQSQAVEGTISRAAAAERMNLPPQVTSFVGRSEEIAEIAKILLQRGLVTLCGPGGMGKTRCAIEAGRSVSDWFADGVWFVDLSAIRVPGEVLSAVIATLKLSISPSAGAGALRTALAGSSMLLVIDNCEHLIDEVRELLEALKPACERLCILTTSREAFNVYGEQVYRMPSLDVQTAVNLFAERAKSANSRFAVSTENTPSVEAICRKLDGIPLAIELAAARVKMFTPRQLEQRLSLGQQQPLRAAFEWSHELLGERERVLFRRLAVFAGTFALEMAAAVCRDDELNEDDVYELVESLVDKSLVQTEIVGEDNRNRLLEPLREYAAEKLAAAAETERFLQAHAHEFARLAEDSYQGWGGSDTAWLPQASSDLANFRVALSWAFANNADVLSGQRIAGSVRSIWSRFDPVEGCRWVGKALENVSDRTPPELVARLELVRAQLNMMLADIPAALKAGTRAIELFSELNDPCALAEARLFAGAATGLMGNSAEGKTHLNEALAAFRELQAHRQIGSTLQYLGLMHLIDDEVDAARSTLSEALEIFRATPGAERAAGHLLQTLAEVQFRSGDVQAALDLAREALEKDSLSHDDVLVVFDLCNVCAYQIALGSYDDAAGTARRALDLARRLQVHMAAWVAFQRFAAIAAFHVDGSSKHAAQLIGFIDARMDASGAKRDYTEQQEYDRVVERLRTHLGETQFDALRAAGANWTEMEAAAVADRIGTAAKRDREGV